MEYTRLGGLTVSRIGYGCYGMSGVYGRRAPEVWRRILQLALELGITYFDAAESYGPAEGILGRELGTDRSRVIIATKVSPGPDGPDLSPQRVVSACEGSLQRLRTGWIDLYQVHFDDPHTPVESTVAALESLKEAGKIREYGIGHLPPDRTAEYLRLGRPVSVLCELSPVAPGALQKLLPLARRHGTAVVAFSCTGRGLLGGAIAADHTFEEGDLRRLDPLFSPDRLAGGLRIRDRLAGIGRPRGTTAVQVGISWVLAQEGVAAALTGPSNPDHLRENACAADRRLPPEVIEEIDRCIGEEMRRVAEAAAGTCRAILSQQLSRQGDRAYGQLLLVAETAAEQGWAEEHELAPLAVRVLRLRSSAAGRYLPELEDVRSELASVVNLPDLR